MSSINATHGLGISRLPPAFFQKPPPAGDEQDGRQQSLETILQMVVSQLADLLSTPDDEDAGPAPLKGACRAGAGGGGHVHRHNDGPPSNGVRDAGPVSNGPTHDGPGKVRLSDFGRLQLPIGEAGKPKQIAGSDLAHTNNAYFQHNGNGSVTFSVPEGGGVTTAHSKFPRSELAEGGTWKMNGGTASLGATLSVDKLPRNGDIVIGQIHQDGHGGKPRPPVELHYDKGKLVASIMDSNSPSAGRHNVVLAEGIKPGEKFSYNMSLSKGGKLDLSAAGHTKSVQLDGSFARSDMYFKAGNYTQDQSGGSAVTFDALGINHSH